MDRTQLHQLIDTVLDLRQTLLSGVVPLPLEAQQNFRAARRETLLGVRALVESMLERMDEGAAGGGEPGSGARSIPVDKD